MEEGWVLLGHTRDGKVYDADGNEIELIRPYLPPDVEIGEMKIYYGGPVPSPEADG